MSATATKKDPRLARAAAMLRTVGQWENRADLLAANFKKTSLRDLTGAELQILIDRLTPDVAARLDQKAAVSPTTRRLRSNVLAVLTEMGRGPERGWKHVNDFLSQPRIAGKLLFDCTDDELKNLVKKLRAIAKKDAEREAELTKMKMWN